MSAVISNTPYYGNSYESSAGPSSGHGYAANVGAPPLSANAPFATNPQYSRPGNLPSQLTPPRPGAQNYWNQYPQSSTGPYGPSTQLTPPSPGAPDYWNKYPPYPQPCGCQPSPSQPVVDFNGWLQTTAPKPFDPCKIYKPGDQVIYYGKVYQAPNQGGAHCGVWPGTDCSKWLYHGTVVNNYNHYLENSPKNEWQQ